MTTLTYNIPAVNCGHYKMTIEREVSELSGVASVSGDGGDKQTLNKKEKPPTNVES